MNFLIRRLSASRYFVPVCLNIFDSAVFLPAVWETKFRIPESTEMYPQLAAAVSGLTLHCAEGRSSCLHHGLCAQRRLRHQRHSLLTLFNGVLVVRSIWLSECYVFTPISLPHLISFCVLLFLKTIIYIYICIYICFQFPNILLFNLLATSFGH